MTPAQKKQAVALVLRLEHDPLDMDARKKIEKLNKEMQRNKT